MHFFFIINAAEGGVGGGDGGDSGDGDDDFVIKWCHRCAGGLGRAWK